MTSIITRQLVDFCQKLTTSIKTLNQTNHTTQFNIKTQPQTIKLYVVVKSMRKCSIYGEMRIFKFITTPKAVSQKCIYTQEHSTINLPISPSVSPSVSLSLFLPLPQMSLIKVCGVMHTHLALVNNKSSHQL